MSWAGNLCFRIFHTVPHKLIVWSDWEVWLCHKGWCVHLMYVLSFCRPLPDSPPESEPYSPPESKYMLEIVNYFVHLWLQDTLFKFWTIHFIKIGEICLLFSVNKKLPIELQLDIQGVNIRTLLQCAYWVTFWMVGFTRMKRLPIS